MVTDVVVSACVNTLAVVFCYILVCHCSALFFSSPLQDDIFVIHIENDFSSMLESMFKTEFLMTLKKRYKDKMNRELPISFSEA